MKRRSMHEWFFMREGFTSFFREPEESGGILFGRDDRRVLDDLLNGLEEGSWGDEGYKAVLYGDYGRGKTHQCMNVLHGIAARQLPVRAVYVKCTEYKAKETFSTLFTQMLLNIGIDDVQEVARKYLALVDDGKAESLEELAKDADIARAMDALQGANKNNIRLALRWLGGDSLAASDRKQIQDGLPAKLEVSTQFAAVLRTLAHMFKRVKGEVLIYLLDESERFKEVTNADAERSWAACLRALTELRGVGFVFFVGALDREDLPAMLTWAEVATRIGGANYRLLQNPGLDSVRQLLLEMAQTYISKGEPPEDLRGAMSEEAAAADVDPALQELVEDDGVSLESYPFTEGALDALVAQSTTDSFANRPREIFKRVQRAAARAMRLDRRVIDEEALEGIRGEGF